MKCLIPFMDMTQPASISQGIPRHRTRAVLT